MRQKLTLAAKSDPLASARAAGLKYTADDKPGFRRVKHGRAFRYLDARGKPAKAKDLKRIRSLVIPPAWTDVWICPDPMGHLQATGRDVRGRKQYRYHPKWREVRDDTKYGRMIDFGHALPVIRRRTDGDLRRPGLPRPKVLAAVVKLLEKTFIRVGNDEYARDNRSFGLTTMRDGHVKVSGSTVRFIFRGKSGVEHELNLEDRRLARIVKQCRDLPGQELFQYRDEQGDVVDVGSADVNAYLKDVTGQDFTSKDFRTWAGTVLCALALAEAGTAASSRQAKRNVTRAIERVAAQLGNTPAISRKCYVHPVVLEAYQQGQTISAPAEGEAEDVVLAFLGRRLARAAPERRAA